MSDYEKLKKQGYTEEEIELILDSISRVEVSDSPMGPGRVDKGTSVINPDNKSTKASNIMVGYNKRNIQLPNGQYASVEEMLQAVSNFLSENTESKIVVCKKTGKIVDTSTIIKEIRESLKGTPGLSIEGLDSRMPGTAYQYKIKGDTAMRSLMGRKIQLDSGEYVQLDELYSSLSNYVYMQEPELIIPILDPGSESEPESKHDPEKEPTPEPNSGIEPESKHDPEKKPTTETPSTIISVKERRKWEKWPLVAATLSTAVILILASIGKDIIGKIDTLINEQSNAGYTVTNIVEEDIIESSEDAVKRALSNHKLGDIVHIDEGTKYDESSDYIGRSETIGSETSIREDDDYTLEYISIVDKNGDHRIINAKFDKGTDVGEVIEQTLDENNLDFDDVQIRFHIGGPTTGWIDGKDILSEEEITPKVIGKIFKADKTYDGVEENFNGVINLETENGRVTLDVTDSNGDLIKEGTVLEGSDGKSYRVDTIEEQVSNEEIVETKTEEKISFSLSNIPKHSAFVAIAESLSLSVIGLLALSERKKKERNFSKSNEEFKGVSEFERVSSKMGRYDSYDESKSNDVSDNIGGINR